MKKKLNLLNKSSEFTKVICKKEAKMETLKPHYDPENPHDISEFLKTIGDICHNEREGYNTATQLIKELSQTQSGRRLLLNCHKVISSQLPRAHTDHKIFSMMQWMQNTFGMFAKGGR
jgi:hypothetical protein